jgi:hypothetical protein
LFWYRAISKNMKIVPNVKPFIKDFFKELWDKLGGMGDARKKADRLFKSVWIYDPIAIYALLLFRQNIFFYFVSISLGFT